MENFCMTPPFVAQPVPPLVMLEMDRSHKLYYQAYGDAADLDGDGKLDITYTHSIDYYGYFDSYKCYTYDSGTGRFNPSSVTTDKFCSSGLWSGNVLNWLTMTRMDALKKVLYGGKRYTDNATTTILARTYVGQDAHSWGKELTGRLCNSGSTYSRSCSTSLDCDSGYTCVDKSVNLIGIAAADAPTTCTGTWTNDPSSWQHGKVLVARYHHSSGKSCGVSNSQGLKNSYEPSNLFRYDYYNGFDDSNLDPNVDHYGENYNIYAETWIWVESADAGVWQFAVDSDDDGEVQVNGTVVASYYGCHGPCNCQDHNGTITLSSGWNQIIARHFEQGGWEGVRVWYKKPSGGAWQYVNNANLGGGTMPLYAPNVVSGNECIIKTTSFIENGWPTSGTVVSGTPHQHLFCSTTLSDDGTPLLRLLTNMTNRIWEWSAKERPVCDNSLGTPTDYTARVKVCDSSVGLEANCKLYGTSNKPTGLLQKYSEKVATPNSKVCSKTFTKTCTADSDCSAANNSGVFQGECIDNVSMLFGLITGSYMKNESGGVLRSNIGSIRNEIDQTNGTIKSAGNIIQTLEHLKVVGYQYSDYSYQAPSGGNCGWITDRPLNEGECRMWGNPIAEMMYEGLRYFAGKGTPTANFTYTNSAGNTDYDIGLPLPTWGYSVGGTTYQSKDIFPPCSKPFELILSDINPNYDSDQIPGSSFPKTDGTYFSEDGSSADPTYLHLGDLTSGASLLNSLADTIGTDEGIAGNNWYIGQSNTLFDTLCTSKNVSKLSLIRGLCPEEPTKRGSYYAAALAYYGKTKMKEKTGVGNITTYSVAIASPVADLKIKSGSNYITIVPTGKSASGCLGVTEGCYNRTAQTLDANGLHINAKSPADPLAFCPTNQIVNFFVDSIRYNAANDVIYAMFRINYEDSEQGADHDMDAIVSYEVCTQAAVSAGYGSCTGSLGSNIQINLSSVYGAGCIDQVLGFIISGTTEDGVYLVVKDRDVPGSSPAPVSGLPLIWTKTFTPSGSAAGFLKNPLWYAAKWGGFNDIDNNGKPFTDSTCGTATPDARCSEWDKNGDGVPDTYFLVTNPLKMEQQLEAAIVSILNRASSGTAASVLASGEGSGANLVQAIFYPKRMFDKEIDWIGTLQNLWYYLDPKVGNSTIREDTTTDNDLKLDQDYITKFFFDDAEQRTKADRYASDAKGLQGAQQTTKYIEDIKFLWEAGKILHDRNISTDPRTIYTTTDGSTLLSGGFTTGNAGTLQTFLNAATLTDAQNIITYARGTSDVDSTLYRNRTVDNGTTNAVWRLGDIINSTPRVVSFVPLNYYDKAYSDQTYTAFLSSDAYKYRGKVISGTSYGTGLVFAGANDGMLHAFKLGALQLVNDGTSKKAGLLGPNLGREEWAYVPKNSLPYLKYLMDKNYCHIYFEDLTPVLVDASICAPGSCTGAYWDVTKDSSSWRTIIIGGMRLGGACNNTGGGNIVQTPIDNVGYSSYFALDITDTLAHPGDLTTYPPKLLWEFSDPTLGYSTSGPAITKINARTVSGPVSYADKNKNGRWFAVFASGPTGPIEEKQFKGKSDQPLRLFIVDLKTGQLARTINTGDASYGADAITNAFGGTAVNAAIDYDNDYQDDALYIGYTKSDGGSPASWTRGGVIRLITMEDLSGSDTSATGATALNPNNWRWSYVMKDIAPVTGGIAHAAHYKTDQLIPDLGWLYFGEGRYFYRQDDMSSSRKIRGIIDPCLRDATVSIPAAGCAVDPSSQFCLECTNGSPTNPKPITGVIDKTCATETSALVACAGACAAEKTALNSCLDAAVSTGWYINLTPSGKRVTSVPTVSPAGIVFFTSFAPSADICKFGGTTSIWAVNYQTGGSVAGSLTGKALLQVSTGAIEEIDLKATISADKESGYRETPDVDGLPPDQPTPLHVAPNPISKILHIRKK